MTKEEALQQFYGFNLSIDIYNASAGELAELQSIIGLRWSSKDDLDEPRLYYYTNSHQYLHDNVRGVGGIDRLTISSECYGRTQMTVRQFLDLFSDIDINESEIECMFNGVTESET